MRRFWLPCGGWGDGPSFEDVVARQVAHSDESAAWVVEQVRTSRSEVTGGIGSV